ncbi:hypothetical protein BB560_001133 [Smittium megazygosporum]|uniref:Uncharacterized protein n=1 Tax=Smittium megazygosporum TaxID=133381 RepID=A0A2T9ZIH9_9FUNG|nr:hypothetical protein BB560_001133 [Smittium megazygosporum]
MLYFSATSEETLPLNPEQHQEIQRSDNYDSISTRQGAQSIKQEDVLQSLASQTANNLINISEQNLEQVESSSPLNKSYAQLLSAFDNASNLSGFIPSVKKNKNNKYSLSPSALYSLAISDPDPESELELVDMAVDQITNTLNELSTIYIGNALVPFSTVSQTSGKNF